MLPHTKVRFFSLVIFIVWVRSFTYEKFHQRDFTSNIKEIDALTTKEDFSVLFLLLNIMNLVRQVKHEDYRLYQSVGWYTYLYQLYN